MKKDGGQAFPVPAGTWHSADGEGNSYGDGMSLRDYFAAAALQRLKLQIYEGSEISTNLEAAAAYCYAFADAMLKARQI